jgi:hypothetical protein
LVLLPVERRGEVVASVVLMLLVTRLAQVVLGTRLTRETHACRTTGENEREHEHQQKGETNRMRAKEGEREGGRGGTCTPEIGFTPQPSQEKPEWRVAIRLVDSFSFLVVFFFFLLLFGLYFSFFFVVVFFFFLSFVPLLSFLILIDGDERCDRNLVTACFMFAELGLRCPALTGLSILCAKSSDMTTSNVLAPNECPLAL